MVLVCTMVLSHEAPTKKNSMMRRIKLQLMSLEGRIHNVFELPILVGVLFRKSKFNVTERGFSLKLTFI